MFKFEAAILKLSIPIFLLSAAVVSAEEPAPDPFGANLTAGLYSQYMFRGKNVYDGTSVQPSATAYYEFGELGTLSGNVWANVPAENREPPEKFTEVDYTISYDIDIDLLKLTVGNIFYTFPSGVGRIGNTQEYFASAALDVPLHPTFTMYNDYHVGKYQYYTLGLSQPFDLNCVAKDVRAIPYVRFGFASNANDGPILYYDNGFEHWEVGTTFEIPVGKTILIPEFYMNIKSDDATVNQFGFALSLSFDV